MKRIDTSTHIQLKLARPPKEDRRVSLNCKDSRVHYSGGLGESNWDLRLGSVNRPPGLQKDRCLASFGAFGIPPSLCLRDPLFFLPQNLSSVAVIDYHVSCYKAHGTWRMASLSPHTTDPNHQIRDAEASQG